MSKSSPSVAVVDETCRAACKALKLQSEQLLKLSSSYAKVPFDCAGDDILQVLRVTMESIQTMQESLTEAAKSMKCDLEETPTTLKVFPDTIVVTGKEYTFLNAVFQEYTDSISSRDYSLFCSPHDICDSARQSCQENAEKSNES